MKIRNVASSGFKFLLILLLASCSGSVQKRPSTQQATPSTAEARKQFRTASALKATDPEKALDKLVDFVRLHPNSDLTDEAYMLIGDILIAKGDTARAAQAYNKVATLPGRPNKLDEARQKLARLYIQQQDWDRGRLVIEEAFKDPETSPEVRQALLKSKMTLFKESRNGNEALKATIALYNSSASESERSSLRAQGYGIVESLIEGEDLDRVASDSDFSFARSAASFKIGLRLYEEGQLDRSTRYLEAVRDASLQTEYSTRADELLKQIDARSKVEPRTIGAILPLSGKNARIGQRALKGIQMALGVFSKDSNFRLAVLDDESNPILARRAAERLVAEDHVIAIVGGLQSRTAAAVASKAQELGVPIVTLSQKAGITDVGEYVFRNAVTSEMQVRHLVETAMTTHKIQRFAILYPNDAYGAEYANLFWDEVLARGGQIRAAQTYDTKETDFRNVVQRLVGTFYIEDRTAEYQMRLKDREKKGIKKSARNDDTIDILPPIADFEAIFVPDSTRALGQIVPMMAYNDVTNLLFIGTNLWNSPDLVERLGKGVPRLLFVDTPKFESLAKASPFLRDFQGLYGNKPDSFEVQAYESAQVLRKLIESGKDDRESLRSALSTTRFFDGVLGKLPLTERREFLRPLSSLTVRDANIVLDKIQE
jgi:branched-chain amino acid transport system substrate-binding protein